MNRSELVRLSGISKQQLSRLENGLIRLGSITSSRSRLTWVTVPSRYCYGADCLAPRCRIPGRGQRPNRRYEDAGTRHPRKYRQRCGQAKRAKKGRHRIP